MSIVFPQSVSGFCVDAITWDWEPGTRDLGPGNLPGTRDLELGTWDLGPGTWDLALGTGSLGPGTWSLGPGTWHLGPGTWDLGARDLGPGTWDLGPVTWDLGRGNLGPGIRNLEPGTWDLGPIWDQEPRKPKRPSCKGLMDCHGIQWKAKGMARRPRDPCTTRGVVPSPSKPP